MMYDLNNPLHRESFKVRANALVKKGCIVEMTEKKPTRSDNQNRYLHAALGYVALEFGETLDYVKETYFKKLCNHDLFVVEKDDKRTGRKEIELRSTASEGCYIPSPDEHRMVQLMEMELERNKMYLR